MEEGDMALNKKATAAISAQDTWTASIQFRKNERGLVIATPLSSSKVSVQLSLGESSADSGSTWYTLLDGTGAARQTLTIPGAMEFIVPIDCSVRAGVATGDYGSDSPVVTVVR
jgi:hypothetical protein